MGVKVPEDRTVMQPVLACCRNPSCRDESNKAFEFFVDHDSFACPKCGSDKSPMVHLKVLTHLLMPHPKGPVIGSGGARYVIACDDKRAYLATATNLEAATDQIKVANCPGCIENAKAINPAKYDTKRVFIVPNQSSEK